MPKQIETPTAIAPHGFARLVQVAKIVEGGLSMTVTAKADDLAKIAAYLELESLKSLCGDVELSRWRGRGVLLTGHFVAQVTQSCVVTLEPVEASVAGDFERRFASDADHKAARSESHEIHVDPAGVDPAEILGREIDLGEILVEELSLALDPYPRKPGVEFAAGQDTVVKPHNPFAVLTRLKGKDTKRKPKP